MNGLAQDSELGGYFPCELSAGLIPRGFRSAAASWAVGGVECHP